LTLQGAVPILPSRDLDETRTFYERLGFRMSGGIYDDYMLPSSTSSSSPTSTR